MEIKSIWYEKYAPKTLDDVILPESLKSRLQKCIEEKALPNLGFWSQEPGLGKSSTAKAIIRTMNADALFINASLERGIDVLRGKIAQFASSNSLDESPKIVVLDESDNIQKDAQSAFRGFIDEFSKNCSFIFTGNYKSKMIEPLLDRLENYTFTEFPKEEMIKPIFMRLSSILELEGVELNAENKMMLAKIIKESYPKIRNMIGTLQRSISNRKFTLDVQSTDFDEIVETMKSKDYLKLITQVNSLTNPDAMYEFLYKNITIFKDIPKAVLFLAKGQFQSDQVRDKNLNLASSLVELTVCL